MASKTLSKDQQNFMWISIACLDILKLPLIDILSYEIQPADLYKRINSTKNVKHFLKKKQLKICFILLPDYNKFDVTLLYTLIRNLCFKSLNPTRGWGKDPISSDKQIGDDIERLRLMSDWFAHFNSAGIPDAEFQPLWNDLKSVIQRIQTFMNYKEGCDVNYEQKLADIERNDFGYGDLQNYKFLEAKLMQLQEERLKDEPEISITGADRVVWGEKTCFEADLKPKETFHWSISWQRVRGSVTYQIDISNEKYRDSTRTKLVIHSVSKDDEGEYQAVLARESNGKKRKIESNSIFLNVMGGESSLNNFNMGSSPVESDARFENVILGLPLSSDSSSNLEEKIQNNLIDSPPQSSRSLSESRSSSSSSSNKNSKPENNTDSNKHSIEAVTLTGHNVSFGSGKKSGQEEDHQPQMIPTLPSRSKEGTEGSDISPIIRDTQIEIALANKKKELDSSYDETHQRKASEQPSSLVADSAHQTCPKSIFLDEHLNSLGNLSMNPKESTSKRFPGLLSEENIGTSTKDVSQTESSRSREPLVHQAQDDTASQKGSSLIQGIRDLTNNLNQVGFEKNPYAARTSWSSINIPVQLAPTATEVGNPIAAPESSTNQSSQFDLFQSESGQQSAANLMGSRQMQGPYTSPVPVSDESEVKNLEMEASALREDMENQSNTVGYRDIQNSIPDQNHRCLKNMEYHSSIVHQFCYSEGGRSRSQGRSNSSNVQTNARESSNRREGSTLGSMSNVLNDCPQLNDSLLNEETLTSNSSS